jgi:hypothetical protein
MEASSTPKTPSTDGQVAALRINRVGNDLRFSLALNQQGDVSGVTRLARVEALGENLEARVAAAVDAFRDQLVKHIADSFPAAAAPSTGAVDIGTGS